MADQQRTTTPQLEELRKEQAKKRDPADPTYILDKAIYQLWETINVLDQIQPERVEHYRVSIFGSSRIKRGDPIYEEVKKLSYELARMGIDIVTGGGPGLMEAANSGATEGQIESHSRANISHAPGTGNKPDLLMSFYRCSGAGSEMASTICPVAFFSFTRVAMSAVTRSWKG